MNLIGVIVVALAFLASSPRTEAAVESYPPPVDHGPRSERRIALTFDACTTPGPDPYDPRITAELERLSVPATIFAGGGWAEKEPAAVRELAQNPLFELGNHTFSHPHLTKLDDDQIREELLRTQVAMRSIAGRTPTLFRPPYGEYDARVVRIAAELGLTTVEYDLPSGDPDRHVTRQALVEWVLREARPGSIVVMHINHRRFPTADALPEIVDGLRARGFELVKVSELLRPLEKGVVARTEPQLANVPPASARPTPPPGIGLGRRALL
jgi:peptidoglycan-N-acetylglucosamine deacetylase